MIHFEKEAGILKSKLDFFLKKDAFVLIEI